MGEARVVQCGDLGDAAIDSLLGRYGIGAEWIAAGAPITGSFWGEPEAGIVGECVFIRPDTPVHSMLHEVCHIVCATPERRAILDGNAGSDDLEEAAVCYLQVLLADYLPGVGQQRLMRDMDAWGYSFRVGNTKGWFDDDAADARAWLERENLITATGTPIFRQRGHRMT